jgi:O-antigen/teichoic acid export membrane protein
MISTTVAAVTNVVLNFIFIPRFGYLAASYTTLISYVLLGIMQYIFMRIVHRGSVFNMQYIVLLSMMLIVCSMLCLELYNYLVIRYLILLALIAVAITFRKRIIRLFTVIRKKGDNAM